MLGRFLEESARLQTEAMRLGTPMFMERDEAEKIAKRTFKPASVERAWDHFAAKCAELLMHPTKRRPIPDDRQ
jgi:hypothetical protein